MVNRNGVWLKPSEWSPYGKVRERLWVRETWFPDAPISGWDGDVAWNGCGRRISDVPEEYRSPKHCIYKASWDGDLTWKPSIHMPRWASRINLEITNVRVERVQDISVEDVIAEGVSTQLREHDACVDLRGKFEALWNQINEQRGFGWDANPWVWVLDFKRI